MPDSGPAISAVGALPYIYPLDEFYAQARLPLPSIERIVGEDIPEPQRSLLVHQKDMTPTLENFHRARIHLKVLRREQRGDFYYREVVLCLDGTEKPVEFGANKVSLGLFPPKARQAILEERLPLGRLLNDFDLAHTTQSKAFFRVKPDTVICEALGLAVPVTLYGRRATISDLQKRPLSEIVEILPPAS